MKSYYHLTHRPKSTVIGCMHHGEGFFNTWKNATMIVFSGIKLGLTGSVIFKVKVPNSNITISQSVED